MPPQVHVELLQFEDAPVDRAITPEELLVELWPPDLVKDEQDAQVEEGAADRQ